MRFSNVTALTLDVYRTLPPSSALRRKFFSETEKLTRRLLDGRDVREILDGHIYVCVC